MPPDAGDLISKGGSTVKLPRSQQMASSIAEVQRVKTPLYSVRDRNDLPRLWKIQGGPVLSLHQMPRRTS